MKKKIKISPLLRLRKRAGFKQSQVAKKLHISQGYVSQLESGKVTVSREYRAALRKICK